MNTMKSMRTEKEIARLSSAIEALRSANREQQDLLAAADRGLEEEVRSVRVELSSSAKTIRKELAAAAKLAATAADRGTCRASQAWIEGVNRRRELEV